MLDFLDGHFAIGGPSWPGLISDGLATGSRGFSGLAAWSKDGKRSSDLAAVPAAASPGEEVRWVINCGEGGSVMVEAIMRLS